MFFTTPSKICFWLIGIVKVLLVTYFIVRGVLFIVNLTLMLEQQHILKPLGLYFHTQKRIMEELSEMKTNFPDFMQFQHQKSSVNQIFVEFDGPEGTLYAGEHFQLLIEPGADYPFHAPKVFLKFSLLVSFCFTFIC